MGGHPCWVQQVGEYPACPECGRTMLFLLQLDSGLPTADGGECARGNSGMCYAFCCDACRVSALLCQDL